MKLIMQISCFNEEATLPETIAALPKSVAGFDQVELFVVDDGSSDRTVEVAREHGVRHIVCLKQHIGLSRAFIEGLQACLNRGADVIVNTDADNQYSADCIPELLLPILKGDADFVIGMRPIHSMDHFGWVKNIFSYVLNSAITIIRTYAIYRPFSFFMGTAILLFLPGFGLGLRFLYYFFTGDGHGHV